MKGGLTKRKAEVKVLAQSDRSALLTKPVDYTVQFGFLADEDDSPSIAVLGAGFGYAGSAPLFSELRFNIGCHSRIALGGEASIWLFLALILALVARWSANRRVQVASTPALGQQCSWSSPEAGGWIVTLEA
eukprot:SAG11_NODE_574_length_8430_cov_11.461769_10_plen_132_part_00